jgi:hypothetical protein
MKELGTPEPPTEAEREHIAKAQKDQSAEEKEAHEFMDEKTIKEAKAADHLGYT